MQASSPGRVRPGIEVSRDPPVLVSEELTCALVCAGMFIEQDICVNVAELVQADLEAEAAFCEALDQPAQRYRPLRSALAVVEKVR